MFTYVHTGCYDGCVYTLDSASGSIVWCYSTEGAESGEPVKSSPITHPSTGWVWFGSHDRHIYCIDIQVNEYDITNIQYYTIQLSEIIYKSV